MKYFIAKQKTDIIYQNKQNNIKKITDDIHHNRMKDDAYRDAYISLSYAIRELSTLRAKGMDDTQALVRYNDCLDIYNSYNDIADIHYDCDMCKDTGIVGDHHCRCYNDTLSHMMSDDNVEYLSSMNICNTNERLRQAYDITKKWCDKYPISHIINIGLFGNTGSGKTHLMRCMARELLYSNASVSFITAFTFNENARKYHMTQPNDISYYTNVDVLFIDDLGSEPIINNVTREYLYNVINERIVSHKPTIISSNLDLSEIMDRYGARIFSRLANKATSLNIMFDNIDLRTGL